MAKIFVLKPHVANQIAAGEVVERPASVVKELVENALDAGATSVEVSIEGGGLRSICVTDNGSGIESEDCKQAFLRHATSKIHSSDDLERIQTLGFRGEALASIASVARVTMKTKTESSETGTCFIIENGMEISKEVCACPVGTTMLVESLFAAVPARLKFLKTTRTEAGYIGDYMARMILARPDVSFRYRSDDKTIYETYGDGDPFNALFCVYGKGVTDYVLPVCYDNGYVRVEGHLGLPEVAKANRTYQTLFVNRRYIKSSALSVAVSQAYGTRLMSGRYPLFVLHLTIAPNEVDVNVHPTKTEVRFSEESRIFSAVLAACRSALEQARMHVEAASWAEPSKEEPKQAFPLSAEEPKWEQSAPSPRAEESLYGNFSKMPSAKRESGEFFPTFSKAMRERPMPGTFVSASEAKQEALPMERELRIHGCAFSTYWIVECENNLYLIDQHAAHERKLYEELSKRDFCIASQALLLPREVRLTPSEMEQWQEQKKSLEDLGFRLQQSGALTLTMEAAPILNGMLLHETYLHEVLSILEENQKVKKELLKSKLMQSACKHAIKAGERIDEGEIRGLLEEFFRGEIPLTCPHGRPILIRLGKTELEKMFRRIV